MTSPITVREFARLTTQPVLWPSLDRAQVSDVDFNWLCKLSSRYRVNHEPALAQLEDSRTLQLDNYVGVIETPSGQVIEILPKTFGEGESREQARRLVRQMLECALDVPSRESAEAALETFDVPLGEWVMARFLNALQHVVRRGVRSEYRRVEAEEPFLRGQLDVMRQMRQPPGRGHFFAQRYDLFLPDRAENRLLKLALEMVAGATQRPESWRLAQELRHLLAAVPASRDVNADFRQWRDDRLVAHYQQARPWCELILYRTLPMALQGECRGISLLFPMEKLFERYVAECLGRQLLDGAGLQPQVASQSLCRHQGRPLFFLKPDLLLTHGHRRWVMDVKWKCLDSHDREGKYGISQGDLYQLFAYGHKYLRESDDGQLVLIYPSWSRLKVPLDPFCFDSKLSLWVLPFMLSADEPHRLHLPDPNAEYGGRTLRLPLRTTTTGE